jgi:hypothetical protein
MSELRKLAEEFICGWFGEDPPYNLAVNDLVKELRSVQAEAFERARDILKVAYDRDEAVDKLEEQARELRQPAPSGEPTYW